MQFYRINSSYHTSVEKSSLNENNLTEEEMENRREEDRVLRMNIAEKTKAFNAGLDRNAAVFFARKHGRGSKGFHHTTVVFVEQQKEVLPLYKAYLKEIGLEKSVDTEITEISFEDTARLLSEANRADFINDEGEFLERIEMVPLIRRCEFGGINFGENMIKEQSQEELENAAMRFLIDEDFLPELKRISEPSATKKKFIGHPVHYIIKTDNVDIRRETCRMLLSALYTAKRLINKRYAFLDIDCETELNEQALETLYKASSGGAIILRYEGGETDDSEYAGSERGLIEMLGNAANRFRHKVLTILCLPKECSRIKESFYEMMPDIRTVEITEEFVSGEKAENRLRMLCKEYNVRPDKKLLAKLKPTEKYRAQELEHLFAEWYDGKLRKDCFPQYKEVASARETMAKQLPKGSAYDELAEMIGLDSAKKVIMDALNYFKAQKVFAEKGMGMDRPSMHMVFTGNPGSAKTTVARLFARILRDNNILSKGTFTETGRSDLVGRYVGHTAPLVKKKFQEAEGGVLFIDEAYALVDDRDGMYGDEAINTIVQEMENHREDVMVIFAGYPDKMEGFLAKNPGLRSRIAFKVPFEDYSTEELMDIANLICKKKGNALTLGAKQKLRTIFEAERENVDFGNGRFVRNILERARMSQATRLLQMDIANVTKEDLATICEEDISEPDVKTTVKHSAIGFCS